MTMVETDVLIVGSGPASASAGLALSTYGVPNIMVTRYSRLADTPRWKSASYTRIETFGYRWQKASMTGWVSSARATP